MRDRYIDNVRGLATISVVFIHTVFCSGGGYTTRELQNLALIFDIPIFFFLTGCTMSVISMTADQILKQIFKLSSYFFLTVLAFQFVFFDFNLNRLVAPLFLASASVPQFEIIQVSYWFVPQYALSLLISFIIIRFLGKYYAIPFILISFILIILNYLGLFSFSFNIFGINTQSTVAFSSIMMIGFYCYKFSNKKNWLVLSLVLFSLLLYIYLTTPFFEFQKFKFPVQLPYLISSLLAISVVMFFKNKNENRLLEFVGKNAIFFYIAQGISSSMLFSLLPYINFNIYLKLCIMFSINLFLALIIGSIITIIAKQLSNMKQSSKCFIFKQ